MTSEALERVRGWFSGRLPEPWRAAPPRVTVDREEITVVLSIADVDLAGDVSTAERAEARAGRARAFREDTREARIEIAREAEKRFERTVSWGVRLGAADGEAGDGTAHEEQWTHASVPVMTRLKQPQRIVLDTLVDAGVARSRSDALGWCVRLVEQHEGDWLAELREAMESVADVRRRGPAA
jgi:post-segregation antitoxin (ccd killing protein)/Arc/MetJ-type ribon-helix-helix transcriptional regulator